MIHLKRKNKAKVVCFSTDYTPVYSVHPDKLIPKKQKQKRVHMPFCVCRALGRSCCHFHNSRLREVLGPVSAHSDQAWSLPDAVRGPLRAQVMAEGYGVGEVSPHGQSED